MECSFLFLCVYLFFLALWPVDTAPIEPAVTTRPGLNLPKFPQHRVMPFGSANESNYSVEANRTIGSGSFTDKVINTTQRIAPRFGPPPPFGVRLGSPNQQRHFQTTLSDFSMMTPPPVFTMEAHPPKNNKVFGFPPTTLPGMTVPPFDPDFEFHDANLHRQEPQGPPIRQGPPLGILRASDPYFPMTKCQSGFSFPVMPGL